MVKRYQCTCPDYQAIAPKNPSASANSELYTRDWRKGFDGVVANGGICEHIYAVLRKTGQLKEYGIPADIVTPPLPEAATIEEVPIGSLEGWK
jgi:hypothetical protein